MIDRRRLIASTASVPFLLRRNVRAQEPFRVLGWAGYVDQGVIDRFKVATGFDLVVDDVTSYDDIFVRLRAGGTSRYSVVAPHHGLVGALKTSELIQPIDLNRVPRAAEVDPHFSLPSDMVIDGQQFAVPLLFGTCPCIYNADLLPEPPGAWADLERDEFTGQIGMVDDALSHFYLAGRATGSVTAPDLMSQEMDRATELLTVLKEDRVSHFTPFMTDLADQLALGKALISTTGAEGMVLHKGPKPANLQIARLAPGDFCFVQALAITSQAPMSEAAHQFIDFMLAPEEQSALANRTARGIVNPAAIDMIDERIRGLVNYGDLDAVLTQSPLLAFPPLSPTGDGAATYVDWVVAWDRIRQTKSKAAP